MRGFEQVITSVGIESMVGSNAWFSQALGLNAFQVSAFGQVSLEHQGAHLNWLLPLGFAESDPLPVLLDNLAMEAGLHGAKFITAVAEVNDCLFETLRRAGYCLCGWQTIWKLTDKSSGSKLDRQCSWSKSDPADALALASLQHKLLSPATRSVTASTAKNMPDFILKVGDSIKGFAKLSCFNNKVLITPVFLDSLSDSEGILAELAADFFSSAEVVFFQQTADMGWLTGSLEKIAAYHTPRKELLVKHFATVEKLPSAELNHSTNGHRADTVTPLLPSTRGRDNI